MKYPNFKSTDKLNINSKTVFCVLLDKETKDFDHIINKKILIDGILYTSKGVERFAHCAPWRAGESIGIYAEKVS